MAFEFFTGTGWTAVSICIGLFTALLAEMRTRRTRWQTAKEIILRDLSTALAEGNAPDGKAILATIRSVMREYGVSGKAGARLEEVCDDMVRMIVADPFLEPKRRTQLQEDAMKMGELTSTAEFQVPAVEKSRVRISAWSVLAGGLAAAAALFTVAGGSALPTEQRTQVAMTTGAVLVCALILLGITTLGGGTRRPQKR